MGSQGTDFDSAQIRNGFDSLCGWVFRPREGAGIHLADEDDGWQHRSYSELADDVARVAALLRDAGVASGSGVILILPTDYVCIASMYAAWLCGGTLTLITPPGFGDGDEYAAHIRSIIEQTDATVVATSPGLAPLVTDAMTKAGVSSSLVQLDADAVAGATPLATATTPELPECALLQFTSGSLGSPRGVRISWPNLRANVDYIIDAVDYRDGEGTASWLPLYHDMGLIGGFLTTVGRQGDLYLLRPDQFVRDPLRWLHAMQHVQHTVTPSFGLGYTARRVQPEDIAGLDLSGWRSIVTGAEPVDVDHLQSFARLLEPAGFSADTYRPAYGLAESTLMVTLARPGQPLLALRVDSASLQFGRPVTVQADTEYGTRELTGPGWVVGVGESTPESTVRIAGDDGATLPDGTLGEIVVSGPSVAAGYHGVEPEDRTDSATTRFVDDELRTGDAGFVHRGQLFVFGRMGSSLKVRGKSVFMEDVETRVAHEAKLSKGKVAAVAMSEADAQGIALFVEQDPGEWITDARRILRGELGPAHNVKIVTGPRGLIRRTSSGKPRRRFLWELLRTGGLPDGVVVHDALTPIGNPTPEPEALLSDAAIARLLDSATAAVDVPSDAAILLEGSIAEGFGNEASDIDFFVLSPGDDKTPAMPTVLFVDGRRVEVRTRSSAELRGHFQYAAAARNSTPAQLLELDQDVLNRCQRSLRARVIRPAADTAAHDELMNVLPYIEFQALMESWWHARAAQSLRYAVAFSALEATPDALDWARDGLQQAIKGWAASKGETYLETKWLGPQLERIGSDPLIERYYTVDAALADEDPAALSAAVALAADLGVADVAEDADRVRFARVSGVTTWPIGSRLHVVRGDADVFVLADDAVPAWRSVVFGRSVADILGRSQHPIARHIAEFVRLGLVGLRWDRREPIRPALAMCKPGKPYTPPPGSQDVLVGLAGAASVPGRTATLSPLPAKRFTECAAELIWSNVVLENAREDLVGAIKHGQGRVADVAAQRLVVAAVRIVASTLGCGPLPSDVAPAATLRGLLPEDSQHREPILDRLARCRRLRFFDDPGSSQAGLAALDEFADAVRTMAGSEFPASFNSREQWRDTLSISYDWLRLAAYLDTSLPIDEAQDLLASGGVQPHLNEASRKDDK